MDHITADQALIQRLLNEGQQASGECSRLLRSYAAKVAEQLTKMFAGNPSRPDDEEFRLMIATWTEALQPFVPEHRFVEIFVTTRQNRNSNFLMDVSEVCATWNRVREAERFALPRVGQYDYRGTSVCPSCKNTG